jgi:folylpolyglutamate synthase/dihydropteroate synthase
MRDKALDLMLDQLDKTFDEIHLTEIEYERSAKITQLKNICNDKGITASEELDAIGFINNFLKGKKENCLVILGSMYLVGDVKKSLIL